jgi:hypothetical protein
VPPTKMARDATQLLKENVTTQQMSFPLVGNPS